MSTHDIDHDVRADAFASAVDTERFGEYRIIQQPDDPRPLYRFEGRISNDGSTPYAAEAGRYHIYSGWFCPWAQRVTIAHALAGLEDVISVSYVDGARDGRGWAFRSTYGPDPVNGFTLLREAYDATEPGFDGHVSVPTLWDRVTGRVVSNQFRTIGIDLATQFGALATPVIDTYPADLADEIEQLDAWIGPNVNKGVHAAAGHGPAAAPARASCSTRSVNSTAAGDEPVPPRRPAHRSRHPAVRHARPLRPGAQCRPHDQRRPQRLSEPVGVRPRPVRHPGVPRHHGFHDLQRLERSWTCRRTVATD